MNYKRKIDCFDFYLWSIGELRLKHEPDQNEIQLLEEEL